jgi:hypothetical protein
MATTQCCSTRTLFHLLLVQTSGSRNLIIVAIFHTNLPE